MSVLRFVEIECGLEASRGFGEREMALNNICNPTVQEQRQEGCEFQASLRYRVSFSTA